MAHENKVLQSINPDGGLVCVDLFVRRDGIYGYDQFRRDPEDGRGWYSIGHHGGTVFSSRAAALADAQPTVDWLAAAMPD